MFERYKLVDQASGIPFTGGRLTIDYNGNVFSQDGNPVKTFMGTDGRLKVTITWFYGLADYDIAFLMAMTYKPTRLPYQYLNRLDVLFADADVTNIHPSNLIWRFPAERLVVANNPEYAYIPFFTDYAISKDGILINVFSGGKVLKPHFDSNYARFKIRNDLGELVSIGRHRLICLAWLDYPRTVDHLVVNHIDGVPGNDYLLNLEFTTRAANNQHASENGLTSKGRNVLVRNVITGEVTEYSGTNSCAEALGLNRSTIKFRLEAPNQTVYYGGLQFKYKYDQTPWRIVELSELENLRLNAKESVEVYSRDIISSEVRCHASIPAAALHTGIPTATIHMHIRKRVAARPIGGFDFSLTNGPWCEYTEDELVILRAQTKGKFTACYITDKVTGITTLYPRDVDAMSALDVKKASLNWALRTGKTFKQRYTAKRFKLSQSPICRNADNKQPLELLETPKAVHTTARREAKPRFEKGTDVTMGNQQRSFSLRRTSNDYRKHSDRWKQVG